MCPCAPAPHPRAHPRPVAEAWQPLQKPDGWLTTSPLLGHQADGYSDIERRHVAYRFAHGRFTCVDKACAKTAEGRPVV